MYHEEEIKRYAGLFGMQGNRTFVSLVFLFSTKILVLLMSFDDV